MTQGQIGYLLESAFAAIDALVQVAALLARVFVDPADDAFADRQAVDQVARRGRGAPPRDSSLGRPRPTPAVAGAASSPARSR